MNYIRLVPLLKLQKDSINLKQIKIKHKYEMEKLHIKELEKQPSVALATKYNKHVSD